MKRVTLSYNQVVHQEIEAEVQVPDHIAELGGNELREWIQEEQPVMEYIDVKHEEIQEDLQDMIVVEVED
jgi:hypothetical protein